MIATVDRRPIKRLGIYGGVPDHPRGISKLWRSVDDWRAWLEPNKGLDLLYQRGWRRFRLHAPAGRPASVAVAQASFGLYHHLHLPEDIRALLKRELAQWLFEHKDAVIGPTIGFGVVDGGRYHMTPQDPDFRTPDPAVQRDRDALLLEVEPWLAISPEPGQVDICFDAARWNAPAFVAWSEEMGRRGVKLIGEAIPETQLGTPAPEAYQAAWWASVGFCSSAKRVGWQWDPISTEIIVGFKNGELTSTAQAAEWKAKGYVLSSWGDTCDDYVLGA